MVKKNIVVVGGGTAGWLTALFLKRRFPDSIITVIESPEIGILGAGEGSTPQLVSLLDELNIPVSDLVKETNATIKNGIKFTNWNGDGDHYYHGFGNRYGNIDGITAYNSYNSYNITTVMKVGNEVPAKNFDFVSKICDLKKVPHAHKNEKDLSINPILNFDNLSDFSIHFDASKLATFLKLKAKEIGIVCIEDKVVEVNSHENGFIKSLILENNKEQFVDFVFDCSGFHRLLIGKHFNSEWDSYKKYLPVDMAIPFFIPIDDEIPPYTEAIAMKYGWMWKIPLQHRYGCGYVFDSSLISEEDATKEIEEYLGFVPEYPRKNKGAFKFNAGGYKTPWVKNCIAIGLASNFIEPLEATSIFSSIDSLRRAVFDTLSLEDCNDSVIDRYNKEVNLYNKNIADFIYFHYMSKRDDSKFWNKFKNLDNAPENVSSMIKTWEHSLPRYSDFAKELPFVYESWISVGYGIGRLNISLFEKVNKHNLYSELFNEKFLTWQIEMQKVADVCVSHNELLDELKK
jgi:tryptophan 7-halogenase